MTLAWNKHTIFMVNDVFIAAQAMQQFDTSDFQSKNQTKETFMKAFATAVALAMVATISHSADAHGPTRKKVEESVVVNAPPAKVWALVGDFNGLNKWVPPVEASTATDGNKVGSVRTLSITGGEKLHEVLESYDAAGMKLSYKLREANVKVLPVNNYSSTIMVTPEGANSKVTWRGAFYRGFMNNNPPAELNDDAAVNAVTGLYKASLEKLKKVAEAK